MTPEAAEIVFVNPMTDIYNSLRKILKDSKIPTSETHEEQLRITRMLDSMVNVQNEIVS
jgi:hypothetical protein